MTTKRLVGHLVTKRSHIIIGVLIIVIGIILLVVGLNTIQVGEKAKARYETVSGKILRFISSEDQRNYENVKDAIIIGQVLEIIGISIVICGSVILIKYGFIK